MTNPRDAARQIRRDLARLARPSPGFDASRYFRDAGRLQFYNVGSSRVRQLVRGIVQANPEWQALDALGLAGILITDRHLEAKAAGIETLARYRRQFTPAMLPIWKRWLAQGHSANWATTDALCGLLIGPLLIMHPALAGIVASWTGHRSLWVRRAAAVGLIPLARRGHALVHAYAVAGRLQHDDEDLIQKAAGWMLREAGKTDMARLERHLRRHGTRMPRTTVRYAIERFPPKKRNALLEATRPAR